MASSKHRHIKRQERNHGRCRSCPTTKLPQFPEHELIRCRSCPTTKAAAAAAPSTGVLTAESPAALTAAAETVALGTRRPPWEGSSRWRARFRQVQKTCADPIGNVGGEDGDNRRQ